MKGLIIFIIFAAVSAQIKELTYSQKPKHELAEYDFSVVCFYDGTA